MHRQSHALKALYTAFILMLGLTSSAAEAARVTLTSLLEETTDLERLARFPRPDYVTRQFSSYDRRSTDPSEATETNWFANHDRKQYLRAEIVDGREEFVLMDANGPGAIVRFWSANPVEGGIVRIYLDHAPEPVVEMPLSIFLGGVAKPFIHPFSGERGRGWNNYLPIPYAKHCKVTIDKDNIFYHINYRTYPPRTSARTFSVAEAEAAMPLIRAKAAALSAPMDASAPSSGNRTGFEANLNAGESFSLPLDQGPAAIRSLSFRVQADDLPAALRGCVLEIAFDSQAPTVCAPLGDFFGTAPGLNPYESLPSGTKEGLLYSHWVMPFRRNAVITVTNHSEKEVYLCGNVTSGDWSWRKDSLYFHAKWRSERDMPTRPFQDWNYLSVEGRGRFVGVMLHIANPFMHWWGEGDEKIYVDGERFPSHFGTGTEDYFGYAWCDTGLFTHAYHNQVRCDGPRNYGHTCVSRFHVIDDIPFVRSFRFDMELWHAAETSVTQAVTAWWYARPGATDNFAPINPALLAIPALPDIPGVEDAIEAETMETLQITQGQARPQEGRDWSQGRKLWWTDAKPGDTLTVGFQAPREGNYDVFAAFTHAPDYGVHQLLLNGVPLGAPRDFYQKEVAPQQAVLLGLHPLKQGLNTLEIQVVGANPRARKAYMFGLDYLLIRQK